MNPRKRDRASLAQMRVQLDRTRQAKEQAEERLELVRSELQDLYQVHHPDTRRLMGRLGDAIKPSDVAACAHCRTPWPCQSWYAIRRLHAASYGHAESAHPVYEPLTLVPSTDENLAGDVDAPGHNTRYCKQ